MNLQRRIALKTALICFGIFLLIAAGIIYYTYKNIDFDTEKKYFVYIATTDIEIGEIINESMITEKEIHESSIVPSMIFSSNDVVGKKTSIKTQAGDYITSYNLISSDEWFEDDERYTILEFNTKEHLAGLVTKNSLIDIKVELNGIYDLPKVVLSKIRVIDFIDEMGNSISVIPSGKAIYAKLLLNEEQRNLLFAAQEKGSLIIELYCNDLQAPAEQKFIIPDEYYKEELIIKEDTK